MSADEDLISPEISRMFENERRGFMQKNRPDLIPCRECGVILRIKEAKTHLPLEKFFPAEMKNVHVFSLRLEKSVITQSIALMCFSTPRGEFYCVVQQAAPFRELYLMDAGPIDSDRHSVCVIMSPGPASFISMNSICPQRCTNCNAPCERTLKCSKCWEVLGLRVVYCCKQCQIANFSVHKHLCGKSITDVNERLTGPQLVIFSDPVITD
jgi:hypothetical protein